jgi:hypothetical protein
MKTRTSNANRVLGQVTLVRYNTLRYGTRPVAIRRPREKGAFAVMFVPLLLLIIAFIGLAIDIGPLYNRKVELNGDGQSSGIGGRT